MALLGVALPNLRGNQIGIDLFPEPVGRSARRTLGSSAFDELLVVRLPLLEQRYLWEAFQRVLRMSEGPCWDTTLRQELLDLDYEKIPSRNHFLYKAHFWPLEDLVSDVPVDIQRLFGTELDSEDPGFLLRLGFSVYRLFEQLITELAGYSSVIKRQLDASRFLENTEVPELNCYRAFLVQLSGEGE